MGEVKSPLGSVQFKSTEGRHFVVDDATSGEPVPAPVQPGQRIAVDEAMEMRARKFAEAEQAEGGAMDPMIKKRLEILMGIGRATTNVTIGEGKMATTFTLRTLKSREQQHVVAAAQDADKTKMLTENYSIRDLTLTYSICAIDGIDIDIVLGVPDNVSLNKRMAMRQAYVGELDDVISMHLYAKYAKMSDEHSSNYTDTPGKEKEVAEQIKKSSQGA
jgi:hypothetical protein